MLSGAFLARAYTSPITLGILIGYVVGKPLGITGASWLLTRLSRGRLRPPVGWAAVAGVGTIAGIGFTVSILIATLAFTGTQLQEAKLGVLYHRARRVRRSPGWSSAPPRLLPDPAAAPRPARHRAGHHRPRRPRSTRPATTSAARPAPR